MKVWANLFFIMLIIVNQPVCAEQFEFGIGPGFREDSIKWNIAGNSSGQNPNILSELTWSDLRISMINIYFQGYDQANWYYQGYFNYGLIVSGSNQDSDYYSDNRQNEFSRSNNNSDSGEISDFSIALGYRFGDGNIGGGFSVIPMIGYSRHVQQLEMTDGYQTIDTRYNLTGPFSGLNSSYDTRWQGVWFGVDLGYDLPQSVEMKLGYEYHNVDYYAEANWNLRSDFQHPVSYTHTADGSGHVVKVMFMIPFNIWALGLEARQSIWETRPGVDLTYFSSGATGKTQLNEVIWESRQLVVKATFYF